MSEYLLKHRNVTVAAIEITDEGKIGKARFTGSGHAPYLGFEDAQMLRKWWELRAIPSNRPRLRDLLKGSGTENADMFLARNLGLSLTDNYWICPASVPLSWENVKLYENFDRTIFLPPQGDLAEKIKLLADSSLVGSLPKKWIANDGKVYIVKESETGDGLQNTNEAFASILHDGQEFGKNNHVHYDTISENDIDKYCICEAFTDENHELVSAYECVCPEKTKGSQSVFEQFIEVAGKHGINPSDVRNFLDYQIMSDFIITNTDRHLNNMGIIRNPETLEFISMAPIFDNGNSMSYNSQIYKDRVTSLEIPITSFLDKEEKLLRYVSNKQILIIEDLPRANKVIDFYMSHGHSEEMASVIAHNYDVKIDLLKDFARGISISLYNEKQKMRNGKDIRHDSELRNISKPEVEEISVPDRLIEDAVEKCEKDQPSNN